MNLAELKKLVSEGETERVEFKRTTGERVEAARTTCALLNATGGFVLFGVSDDGRIQGQQVSESTYRDIQGELDKIEPPAFPDVETVSVGKGLTAIVLRVPGEGGPYTYDGRAYYRQGTSTRRMPQPRYERRLLERMHAGRRWENLPAERLTLKDLDRSEVIRTVDEAVRNRRMEAPASRNLKDLLVHLGLLEGDRLLNAAIVLFAKPEKILPNYPQCLLRMARFRGDNKDEFLDNRQEFGNAFDLLIRAQRFLRDHLPVAGRILPNVFKREDDPLYPPAALREALANALCHRDYSIPGGSIGIAIYDDRLEIESIGPLPFDVTPESLLRPHRSQPWNPIVSSVFYRRGIIEHWGRGTLKMRELCAEAGLPPPEFEASKGDVLVRFRPPRGKGHAPLQSTAQAFAEVAAEVTAQVTAEVTAQILRFCHDPRKSSEIMGLLNLKHWKTFRSNYLAPLLSMGLLEMTIPDKPRSSKQRYRITEKGKGWLAQHGGK